MKSKRTIKPAAGKSRVTPEGAVKAARTEPIPIRPAGLQPDADLISSLSSLLEQARSGELGGIAYIGYRVDREVTWGVVGPEMAGQNLRTYGLLHWLANRAMARWEDRNEHD